MQQNSVYEPPVIVNAGSFAEVTLGGPVGMIDGSSFLKTF